MKSYEQQSQPKDIKKSEEQKLEDEYAKTLSEIEKILNTSSKNQERFIKKRISYLSQGIEGEKTLHDAMTSSYEGFLTPQIRISHSGLVDPLIMDDDSLYLEFFKTVQDLRKQEGWKGKSLREIIPYAIQWTISRYFGNTVPGPDTKEQNKEFYENHTTPVSPPVSIGEFKGKNIAVCAEKAAAAQNLLVFVGLKSTLIFSRGCHLPLEATEESHCYNLVHSPRGYMIYDPTNPVLILNTNGELKSYRPAIYPISKEQFDTLTNGGSVVVEHIDFKEDEDGQLIEVKSNRVYGGATRQQNVSRLN